MARHLDAEAFAALVQGTPFETLQHLLTCARCRRRLSEILLDIGMPVDEAPSPWEMTAPSLRAPREPAGDVPDELAAARAGRLATARLAQLTLETILDSAIEHLASEGFPAADSPEARLLVEGLLKLPPDVRIEAVEAQTRYRAPEMVDILLSQARSNRDPIASRHLAGLAGAILGFHTGSLRRQRVECLVSCILADAERRMGRLDLSEDIFRDATDAMRDQPLILEERVVLCRHLAALRQEQGRVDEALGLLEHASTVAEELGSFHELALARLAYGWLLLDEYDSERAILPLREAFALSEAAYPGEEAPGKEAPADAAGDVHAAFSALHALALAYADLGDDDYLGETFAVLDQWVPRLPDPLDRIRTCWIHARAEARRNQYETALPILQEVFESLLARGPGEEAALAALDLARMTAEHALEDPSFPVRLERIAQDLFALPAERLAPHLRFVLRFALDFPKRRAGAFLDVLLCATAYVERARFNPTYPFQPTPEPERIMLWRDLTRSQRRQAALSAGVELNRDGFPLSTQDHLLLSWTHEALTGARIQLPLSLEDETQGLL